MTDPTHGDHEPVAPADLQPEVDAEVVSDLDVQLHDATDVKGGCKYGTITGASRPTK